MLSVLRVPFVLRVLVLVALEVLVVLAGAAVAQVGVITGKVVDGVTGQPIGAALVAIGGTGLTVNPIPNQPNRILTAADGRFVFGSLAAGTYMIRATKGGYADGGSGSRRPSGDPEPIELTQVAPSAVTVVRLWKNGSITGTVTDEAGEPVVGLSVRLLLRPKLGAPPAGSGFARPYTPFDCPRPTDDRGVYRFSGLPPGDYVVVAAPPSLSAARRVMTDAGGRGRPVFPTPGGTCWSSPSMSMVDAITPFRIADAVIMVGGPTLLPPSAGGRVRVYPTTFYPAASVVSQASVITIAAGEERAGVDIQLTPVTVARVSGIFAGLTAAEPIVTLRLAPAGAESLPDGVEAPASVVDGAGNFVFAAVPPGRYTLTGGVLRAGSVRLPLTVGDADIDGVVVTMTPAPRLTVSVQFDGVASAPPFDARGPLNMPALILDPADFASALGRAGVSIAPVNSSYVVNGYPPGRYRVRVPNSPSGWTFKAAMLNGIDVSETPFDFSRDVDGLTLVFTDRSTVLSGIIQGKGADAAIVLAFPSDASKWTGDGFAPRRFTASSATRRGEFAVHSLPPGEYFVVAIPEEQSDGWREPSTLEALSRIATEITITDDEHRIVSLRVREIRP